MVDCTPVTAGRQRESAIARVVDSQAAPGGRWEPATDAGHHGFACPFGRFPSQCSPNELWLTSLMSERQRWTWGRQLRRRVILCYGVPKEQRRTLPKIINFLNTDIWRIRLADYSRTKSFMLQQLRVITLAFRRYHEDSYMFRASALTFYSLLSIVPVIAMLFGIAKGFGLEKRVETEILRRFKGQEEVAERIVTFANSLLENTRGGVIAGVGVMILFWSVMKVLGNIEHSFNEIWGVTKPRSLGRKFSDYFSLHTRVPGFDGCGRQYDSRREQSRETAAGEDRISELTWARPALAAEALALRHHMGHLYIHIHLHAEHQGEVESRLDRQVGRDEVL